MSATVELQLDCFVAANADRLGYLRDRWQDEREYEDFADYVAEMRRLLPNDFTFLKATRSPFGFQFCHRGSDTRWRVEVDARRVRLVRMV